MAQYEMVTVWEIKAPIESVWASIRALEVWPEWWSFIADVVEIDPGDENGLGAVHRLDWKTRLPYSLSFESVVVRIKKPILIEATVDGELVGNGTWHLSQTSDITVVRHDWRVSTSTLSR